MQRIMARSCSSLGLSASVSTTLIIPPRATDRGLARSFAAPPRPHPARPRVFAVLGRTGLFASDNRQPVLIFGDDAADSLLSRRCILRCPRPLQLSKIVANTNGPPDFSCLLRFFRPL